MKLYELFIVMAILFSFLCVLVMSILRWCSVVEWPWLWITSPIWMLFCVLVTGVGVGFWNESRKMSKRF